MYTQKELEERFQKIIDNVNSRENPNMNTLLAPQVCSCDAKALTSVVKYKAMDWERNQRGEIHGGAVAAMFDTSVGLSISAFSKDEKITTTDLAVSYIRPFSGEEFIFNVEIIRMGRTMVRARAIAYDEASGKTLASATANFMYVNR